MADLYFKVLELENIIKMKDLELRMKDEQIKLLNDTINFLKQKDTLISQRIPPEDTLISETISPEDTLISEKLSPEDTLISGKLSTEETLVSKKITKPIKTVRVADDFTFINIEDFFKDYILNTETKYTYKFENGTTKFIAFKPQYYKREYSIFNVMKANIEIITDAINKLPKNTSFFKLCDKNRKKFQIKTNNEIIPSSNQEEIDKLIFKLFNDTNNLLLKAFVNFNSYFAKKWVYMSSEDNEIYRNALQKRADGLPLTNQEEALIKRRNSNNKLKNEFNKITGIDYELLRSSNGWFDNLSLCFYSFESKELKSGFFKLKNFLATGAYDKSEIEAHYKKQIQYHKKLQEEDSDSGDSDNSDNSEEY